MPYKYTHYRPPVDEDDDEDYSPPPPVRKSAASKYESSAPNQAKAVYDPKRAIARNSEPTGGPVTANYTEFIQKLFDPANQIRRSASALADYSDMAYTKEIPASLQLKVERMEAAADLGSSKYGRGTYESKIYSPMARMTDLYASSGLEDKPYAKYDVYQPKSNAEYFSVYNNKPQVTETPSIHYKVAKTATSPNYWNYKPPYESSTHRLDGDYKRHSSVPRSPKHYVIDYSSFRSAPLSPYLYPGYEYVKRHDSRIVGSDFVMLTMRPNDDFLHKIDKTLAEARKVNSWD